MENGCKLEWILGFWFSYGKFLVWGNVEKKKFDRFDDIGKIL